MMQRARKRRALWLSWVLLLAIGQLAVSASVHAHRRVHGGAPVVQAAAPDEAASALQDGRGCVLCALFAGCSAACGGERAVALASAPALSWRVPEVPLLAAARTWAATASRAPPSALQ